MKLLFILVMLLLSTSANAIEFGRPVHGLAMYGKPKYSENFSHFDYVNPDAPKRGKITYGATGTFDSLNPYLLKGVSADGIGKIYDTLTVSSDDETFSRYGLIAETMEVAPDKKSITFNINPKARWHDNVPITADDVVFSFNTIMKDGHPQYKSYYADATNAEKLNNLKVKFNFKNDTNRELPMIIGDLPILPKHYYEKVDFSKTTLTPPLGNGAYKVKSLDPGRGIIYERVKNYWAADLPVNKGKDNFDEIEYKYYRDETVAIEAFKGGDFDFRQENIARVWATSYDFPALRDGKVIKDEIKHSIPVGMQGFAFNLRRDKFKDIRVRKALSQAWNFEWSNKALFFGSYIRSNSFFENSIYASEGLPDKNELKLLEPFRGKIPDEVFTEAYIPPVNGEDGNARPNLIKARDLLKQAGWVIKDGQLTSEKSGEKMEIEFLISSKSMERVIMPMIPNLKKLGIKSTIRTVDSSQYIKRIEDFDFDITVHVFGQSNSPGNEQMDYWHSSRADIKGGRNVAGIKNEAVDRLTEQILKDNTLEELVTNCKALDRVLLNEYIVIPQHHFPKFRVIYFNKFEHPKNRPLYSLGVDTWWAK
jgi:microcin C transport system substrate-binding protein